MRTFIAVIAFALTLLIPAVAWSAISDVDKATMPITNLMPNGGFEGGLVGWSVSGGSKQIITTPATSIGSGKAALAWDASAAGQHILSGVIPVPARLAGKTGAFWCHFQTPSGNSTHQITMMAADGTTPLRTPITIDSQTTYQIKGSTFQFPLSGGVRLHAEAVAANEPLVNVDDCWVSDANGTMMQLLQDWPQYSLTVTGTNWTTTRAVGIPYQTPDGTWRLRFNVRGSDAVTVSSITLSVSGVTFKNISNYSQSMSAWCGGSARGYTSAWVDPNTSNFRVSCDTGVVVGTVGFSGDVELESKPSWATDTRSMGIKLDQQIDFTSAIFMYPGDCPSGTIPATGKSLGKNSGDYQGANYFTLYSKLWALPGLSTTSGDPFRISSAKGASAQADWDALKTITVDFSTNELFVRQDGSNTTLGAKQDDAFQGHVHSIDPTDFAGFNSVNSSGAPVKNEATPHWFSKTLSIGAPISDGTNGTPRTATETRPKNVALNYCMNPSMVAPQPVIPGEKIVARAKASADQSIPGSSAPYVVQFNGVTYDSTGSITTGSSWKFTAPVDGVYSIKAIVSFSALESWLAGTDLSLNLYKGGVFYSKFSSLRTRSAVTTDRLGPISGVDSISLKTGEYIQVMAMQTESSSRTITYNVLAETIISIEKVGSL